MSKPARRLPGDGCVIVGGPRQYRKGNRARDVPPTAPAWQLRQIVGADQPDEMHPREQTLQITHRIERESAAKISLDVGRHDAVSIGDGVGRGQPLLQRRHPGRLLQWIAGRYEQPDLIEPKAPKRDFSDMAMPAMRRVEAPAEQPDTQPTPVAKAGKRIQA